MERIIRLLICISLVNIVFLAFVQSSWLRVSIEGLPSQSQTPIVVVQRLGGATHYLSQSILLGNLYSGEYIISGVPAVVGEQNFIPDPLYPQTVQVVHYQLNEVTIHYKLQGDSNSGSTDSDSGSTDSGSNTDTDSGTNSGASMLICEITSGPIASHYAAWVELYNPNGQSVNLANYQLNSPSGKLDDAADPLQIRGFSLPNYNVPPKGYVVLRARSSPVFKNGSKQVYLDSGVNIPRWQAFGGSLELLQGGQTVDYMSWGENEDTPTSSGAWEGESINTAQAGQIGSSLARDVNCTDTNQASDWHPKLYATPAGPNDVPADVTDLDRDGIPDSAEVAGGSFAGLDLFAMGARADRPDIFIEVDVMESDDEGTQPRRESLDRVVKAFAKENIAVHFDVGTLYNSSESLHPEDYNLGGGDPKVPYVPSIELAHEPLHLNGRGSFYTYKSQYMDTARISVFHYLLMGSSRMADGGAGSAGAAELNGNDILITLGKWGLNSNSEKNTNILISYQSANIMHELGHNLGLGHGGKDATNLQPNHLSIMNYLYAIEGVGPARGEGVGDRYYQYKGWKKISRCDLVNSSCSTSHVIDFSHGLGEDIDENSINEGIGIGYGPAWVDYNNDGKESVISYDLNQDDQLTVIEDFDDWSFISLPFQRHFGGAFAVTPFTINPREPLSPIANDFQPRISEDPLPRSFFRELSEEMASP